MNELMNKYFAMKQQAIENMQHGNVNSYLAKLIVLKRSANANASDQQSELINHIIGV